MEFSKDALGKKESNDAGNMNDVSSAEIADIKKKMDEQVEEMKELSKATMAIVGKVKKLKVDEVSSDMDRIDARLEVLEEHMAALDKNMACVGTCAKNDELPKQDAWPDNVEATKLPDLPMKKEGSHTDEKALNVIETTMDAKNANDCVSETIKQYENGKTVQGPGKSGIFKKFMGKVLPGKKKDVAQQAPENVRDEPVSVVPESDKKEMPEGNMARSPPCDVCGSDEVMAKPDDARDNEIIAKPDDASDNVDDRLDAVEACESEAEPVENSAVHVKEEAEPVEKPDVNLMAIDKNELRAKMEEVIASAEQMASERRYSDATEVYLKLSDAYEKNKDNPRVQELGPRINELYDKISSNLLNNLMTSDEGQNMSALGENKSI